MRNLLAFLAAVTLTVIVAGWYLNWYSIVSVPADNGHRKLSIDIHTDKVGEDLQKGGESMGKWLENTTRKTAAQAKPEGGTPPTGTEDKKEQPVKEVSIPMPK